MSKVRFIAARCYASATYAVTRCPSVSLSVTFVNSFKTRNRRPIFKFFFHHQVYPRHSSFTVPNGMAIFRWEPSVERVLHVVRWSTLTTSSGIYVIGQTNIQQRTVSDQVEILPHALLPNDSHEIDADPETF